jgi:hypothetical protein
LRKIKTCDTLKRVSIFLSARELKIILARSLAPITALLVSIEGNQHKIMSAVDDKIAIVQASVAKFGTDLKAEIDGLKAEIALGGDTAERLSALDNIAAQLQGLDALAVAATPAPPASNAASTEPAPAPEAVQAAS